MASTPDVRFEARASAVGDVDEAGRSFVVTGDAVELREHDGRVAGHIAMADIDAVEVQQRFGAARITIRTADGASLTLGGLRRRTARGLRDVLGQIRVPAQHRSGSPATAEQLRRLEELAALGLLTDKELAERRSEVARRTIRS